MKMIRRNQKGFTLIEALIVVIIVAILATLGISRFLGVREATADATCKSHLSTINSAIKKYDLDHPFAPFTNQTDEWTAVYDDAGNPKCPDGTVALGAGVATGGYSAELVTGSTTEYHAICDNEDTTKETHML